MYPQEASLGSKIIMVVWLFILTLAAIVMLYLYYAYLY